MIGWPGQLSSRHKSRGFMLVSWQYGCKQNYYPFLEAIPSVINNVPYITIYETRAVHLIHHPSQTNMSGNLYPWILHALVMPIESSDSCSLLTYSFVLQFLTVSILWKVNCFQVNPLILNWCSRRYLWYFFQNIFIFQC